MTVNTKKAVPKDLIDSLLADYKKPEDLIGENGLLKQLTKLLVERALDAEMSEHLGHHKNAPVTNPDGNARNGKSKKTLKGEFGELPIEIPRDRQGSFEPQLIPKHQTRWAGFDDKILSLYARGMSTREIAGHVREIFGLEVSADLVSAVTDAVLDEIAAWQQRPLETMYPVVFFDALRVKIREDGVVRNKAIYLALGILPDGTRDILGLWIENTEGAKFWMKVFNDLKTRGVEDVLIAVTDGLKGMPEALSAVFPETTLQTCIVHLIRNSLDYAAWDKRRALAKALKPIYQAINAEAAEQALDEFENGPWGKQYPTVVAAWRRAWDRVIPFFVFPPAIRKVIYTTNAIESINAQLRKIIKTRGHFPNDDAATKLIWLGLRNITANWGSAAHDWKSAMNQFAILYGDRFIRPTW